MLLCTPLAHAINDTAGSGLAFDLINTNQAAITGCIGGLSSCPASLTIPDTVSDGTSSYQVTEIADYAFYEHGGPGGNVSSVTFAGSGLVAIGDQAFANNQLTSLVLPDSVTSLGNATFYGNQLTSLTLPANITTIFDWAFSHNQLTSVDLPESVVILREYAFSHNQLKSITLPGNLELIEWGVFYVNALTRLTVPASVNTIEGSAFRDNQLTRIDFLGERPELIERPFRKDAAYSSNQNLTLITYLYGQNRWPGEDIEGITPTAMGGPVNPDNSGNFSNTRAIPAVPGVLLLLLGVLLAGAARQKQIR